MCHLCNTSRLLPKEGYPLISVNVYAVNMERATGLETVALSLNYGPDKKYSIIKQILIKCKER